MREMKDQVALVTGASRGIGRACAEKFASEGAKIVLNYCIEADEFYRKREAATETVATVRGLGAEVLPYQADVTDRREVGAMVEAAERRFGHIDILVNNAGIGGTKISVAALPEEDWDRIIEVNLKGQFLVTQAVAPGMIRRRTGKIVNVSSELALCGNEERVAYCASKAGVIGFTKALARELAPFGILVNCVCPGPTNTDMLTGAGSVPEAYVQSIPLRRVGEPQEVAAAIYFLASPHNTYATGQIFSPNGGTVI